MGMVASIVGTVVITIIISTEEPREEKETRIHSMNSGMKKNRFFCSKRPNIAAAVREVTTTIISTVGSTGDVHGRDRSCRMCWMLNRE